MLSVLILTKNEERNIAKVIRSVGFSDDVVVLDSLSTDRTQEIAKSLGAKVVERKLEDWAVHHNWAVQNIEFKYPWVLYLDADEVCDETLCREILEAVQKNPTESAFRMRRKDFFMGRWLRRSQLYPTWLIRLFRPEAMIWTRSINPVPHVNGAIGVLTGHILHEPFSHGVAHWFERHNRYSDLEAVESVRDFKIPISWKNILGDPTQRRNALKQIAYRIPGRPTFVFLYLYLFRLGFLDGVPGYYYSRMRSAYELMIDVKVQNMKYQAQFCDKDEGKE